MKGKNGRITNAILGLSEVLRGHPGQQINMETSLRSKNNSMQKTNGNAKQQPKRNVCTKTETIKVGIHRCSKTKTTLCMYDLGELNKHNTTVKKAESPRQASSQINHYNN